MSTLKVYARVYIDTSIYIDTHFFTHAQDFLVGEQSVVQSLDPVNVATWTLLALDDLVQAPYICQFSARACSCEYNVYSYIFFLFFDEDEVDITQHMRVITLLA